MGPGSARYEVNISTFSSDAPSQSSTLPLLFLQLFRVHYSKNNTSYFYSGKYSTFHKAQKRTSAQLSDIQSCKHIKRTLFLKSISGQQTRVCSFSSNRSILPPYDANFIRNGCHWMWGRTRRDQLICVRIIIFIFASPDSPYEPDI